MAGEKMTYNPHAYFEKAGDEQGNYESLPTHEGPGPYAPQHETNAVKNPTGDGK